MNCEKAVNEIVAWIKSYWKNNGMENAVIGMSGGKDSTVAAALLIKALGADHVFGLSMPDSDERVLPAGSETMTAVQAVGMYQFEVFPLGGVKTLMRGTFIDCTIKTPSRQADLNIMPRLRMAALYQYSQTIGKSLVACNANLSEIIAGYGTLFGDTAGDFALLANLLVNEVVEIGEYLGIPSDIVKRPPADGLTGRTDEEVLGFKYADVASLYWRIAKEFDCEYPCDVMFTLSVIKAGLPDEEEEKPYVDFRNSLPENEKKVLAAYARNEFKRNMLFIPGPEFLLADLED